MVAHGRDLLVTGLLATVSVASVCGQVVTRGILVPPGTQNNSVSILFAIIRKKVTFVLVGVAIVNVMKNH